MKRKLIVLFSSLALVLVGAWLADRKLKGHGHPGLARFMHQLWVNYPASFAVEPVVLSLHVDQRDLDAIHEVVQAARERGVIMPEGNEYVPAELTSEGSSFKAKVRIKGKMSDHVQGSKWSFRVIAKKDDGFMGMQRFSLQHPGTRNYLCDWFFHRLSAGEGIIALRYGFIRLEFNGEDLGVYAYEEHFGPELLAHNGRLKGPLFRFDPGLFWEHRLNMLKKVRYNEPFGTYQASAVDAFGSSDLGKDSVQRAYFEEAVAKMDAFRRAELPASRVFDVERVAKRHAILDLVGGHHSMDWSDVKFYYDPVLKRIEPVAYESFSAFPIRTLAGYGRYIGHQDPRMDLHDAYFNDPDLFRAYVHELERVSRASYLDSAFAVLGPALDSASALIYREFPYKELDRSIYYKNQALIRKMLDVPKGFHAYLNSQGDTVRVTIVPIEALPIQVHGAVADDGSILPVAEEVIVPSRTGGRPGEPMEILVPVGDAITWLPGKAFRLKYSVLGASVVKELEVFPYAYTDGLMIPAFTKNGTTDLGALPYLHVEEATNTIQFLPGNWTVSTDLFLPEGYTVRATAPLRLDLKNGARIISRSPFHWQGMEDLALVISSSDMSGGGLVLLETGGTNGFDKVRFEGFGSNADGSAALIVQGVTVHLSDCTLGEDRERDIMLAVRGEVVIKNCTFTGGRDQLTLAYARNELAGLTMLGARDDALSIKGGACTVTGLSVEGARGMGLKLDEAAAVTVTGSKVFSSKDALHVSEGAKVGYRGGALVATEGHGVDVEAKHDRHGPSTVMLKGVKVEGLPEAFRIGKGNEVSMDGRTIAANTNTSKEKP
ncbi:MAG: CotH kinase family protein [Flavobacteriales bacterium]|nr:CotH kinase family protein [Flavobacteriales bacterium]